MKGFLFLAVFSLSYGFYGHITRDTTWRDTVLITGDVVVDQNARLTISPGTLVLFLANSSNWDTSGGRNNLCDIIVYGKLKANGYESHSITFSPDDTTGRWGGICFINSKGDTLSYVKIMFCIHAITADLSSIYITNTSIENAYGTGGVGVTALKSTLTLKDVNISNCYYLWPNDHTMGIYAVECTLELISCQISNCRGADGIEGADSPACGMDGIGIYSRNSTLRITGSTIKECEGGDAEGWQYPTFPGKGIGIVVEDTTGSVEFSFITKSNIYSNADLNLEVNSSHTLNAQYNYWGSIKEDEIIKTLVGDVYYSPWTDSTHTHLYHSKYFSGEITKDTTWSGEIWVNGDVIVPEGVTLTLRPGTKIFLADRSLYNYGGISNECDLIVYGKFKAVGTLKDSIRVSVDSLGRWGSIRIYGDNDDTLQYVTISHAWFGIYCDSASPLISNCKIQYIGNSGIVCVNNASPQIMKNYISNCRGDHGRGGEWGRGIYCSCSNPKIIYNIIKHCRGGDATEKLPHSEMYGGWGIGIHCKGTSSPVIRKNVISDCKGGNIWNCWDPMMCIPGNGVCILCEDEASPKIFLNKISNFIGGERVEGLSAHRALSRVGEELFQGTGYGVACQGSSQPIIGGSIRNQNDFSQDTSYCWLPYYFVANFTTNDIIATHNWWGTTSQNIIEGYIYDHNDKSQYGYVIYEPWAEDSLGIEEKPKRQVASFLRPSLQIYPNPAKQAVCIKYRGINLPAVLEIYDVGGRLVKNFSITKLCSQPHIIHWDGRDKEGRKLPNGVYFCQIMENKSTGVIKKIVLIR